MELGKREFSEVDQLAFARLSNDRNPMHLDRQAARRTQMGAPVVHGINGVLWSLDLACTMEAKAFSTLKVNFSSPIYLGDDVRVLLLKQNEEQLRLQTRVGDALTTAISINLGDLGDAEIQLPPIAPMNSQWPSTPLVHELGELTDFAGCFEISTHDAVALYPKLSRRMGASRVAGLAALSRLVGMICPGLHSIFSGLNLRFVPCSDNQMRFSVIEIDARFNIVRMLVSGSGLEGEVTAIVRPAPTAQPSMSDVKMLVPGDAYRNANVLVVGGSRGLGEVTAKACAAGGANVTITYASGRDEAASVAAEIEAAGGVCDVVHLDVQRGDIPSQLASLKRPTTHLYYYATGPIAQRRTQFLSGDILASFLQFYAIGFADVCQSIITSGGPLVAFYPSSVAIDDTPKGWVEYAMTKAAGELLCREMSLQLPGLQVFQRRLPRILTDQTATSRGGDGADVLGVILPIVDEIQTLAFTALRDRRHPTGLDACP